MAPLLLSLASPSTDSTLIPLYARQWLHLSMRIFGTKSNVMITVFTAVQFTQIVWLSQKSEKNIRINCISILFLAAGVKIGSYSRVCIAALHAWLKTVLCIKLATEFVISRFLIKIKNIDYSSQLNVCRIWYVVGLSSRVWCTEIRPILI